MNSDMIKDLAYTSGENNILIYANGYINSEIRLKDSCKVTKELQLYKNKQNVFKDLIYIFKKPEFLFACYQKIQGKASGQTAEKVNEDLILNLSNSIVKGQFNFSALRSRPRDRSLDLDLGRRMNALYKQGDLSTQKRNPSYTNGKIPIKDQIVLKGLVTILKVI